MVGNVCHLQDLPYRSSHLHFRRFARQTIGRNILFGRTERGMNLQLTSNQNFFYRTNDFVMEIQPIDVRDGDTYILVISVSK